MSERKTRREIDKAIKHLMAYTGPNGEWEGRFEQVQEDLLGPLANKLEMKFEDLMEFFLSGPYAHMLIGFAFEEFATVLWDNEKQNLIGAYLKQRGWREGPAGRRYLQALGESELQFWEITAAKPGSYVDIRHYGTQEDPIRVKEKAASESLHQWDGLVARVLRMGGGTVFSGAMLPFRPDLAARVQSVLSVVPDETEQLVQDLIEQGEMEAAPENLEEIIRFTQESELAGVAFLIWAMDVYVETTRPSPSFQNMDNEPVEPTGVRFSLNANRSTVARALDASPVLHRDSGASNWNWFPEPYDGTDIGERMRVLGQIILGEDSLQLATHSVARAERGRALLVALLGDLAGPPLTVHDNSAYINDSGDALDSLAEIPPEIEQAITGPVDQPLPKNSG